MTIIVVPTISGGGGGMSKIEYGKTRVTNYEFRVTSYDLKA